MAEEAQATAANPVGTAEPAPAFAPAPVNAGPGGQGGAGPATDDGFARIPRSELDALKANDGRYRQFQQQGHTETLQFLQEQGLTRQELQETVAALDEGVSLRDILKYFRTPDPAPETGGGYQPPQTGSGQPPQGLTVDQLDQWWDRKQAKEAESRTQAEQKAADEAANVTLKKHWDTVLADKLKVEPNTAKHRSASGLIPHALNGAIAERLQREDALLSPGDALQKAKTIMPSTEDLDRATERVTNDWKDLGNEIVSAAAAGQAGFPAGTLGAGAGGPIPPPGTAGEITPDQEREMIFNEVRSVAQRMGKSTDLP